MKSLTEEQKLRLKTIKENFDSILSQNNGKLSDNDKRNFKDTINIITFDFTRDLQQEIKEEMKFYLQLLP